MMRRKNVRRTKERTKEKINVRKSGKWKWRSEKDDDLKERKKDRKKEEMKERKRMMNKQKESPAESIKIILWFDESLSYGLFGWRRNWIVCNL